MHDTVFHRALYLTGPTASGKTAIGVRLARRLDAEVVALDSMTLYRSMNIGTAKPSMEEREDVPHHLLDLVDPWSSASVADYVGWASEAAREIESRGRRVLFVGGTPLYLKALLRGLFEGPKAQPELRRDLEDEARRLGDPTLHARLAALDPPTARRLHPNDRRRVIRALEVISSTGLPLSVLQAEHDRPAPPGVRVLALEPPRARVHSRINRRVLAMISGGLVEEVRALRSDPRGIHQVPAQGVGYREMLEHLADPERAPLESTVERIQARTRQFAKRQETWFRGLAEVEAVPIDPEEPASTIAERLLPRLEPGPR